MVRVLQRLWSSSITHRIALGNLYFSTVALGQMTGKNLWYATTIDNQAGADKITAALAQLGDDKLDVKKIAVHSYFWWDDKLIIL